MRDERQQDHPLMLYLMAAIVVVPLFLVALACGGFLFLRLLTPSALPPVTSPAPPMTPAPVKTPAPATLPSPPASE